ncbi:MULTISPECIES: DUF6114 domain-containing protein [Streptomyces]|uniref:DUF6114 domain-containing protein n=1 Tax=Streptomyces TaxID=1883 RepID=UPI00093F3E00|nr:MULTISPECIES: DUF6114 domain-containing protein [Streptomyces]MBX9422851.1 hypothetical protein [Streptomyces lateritius]OKJ67562.1 hypothetical protein AMK29_05605 [Streptomyces sp. CB02261]
MSAETPASREVPKENRFKAWRQTRPFWAGLFTIIGGVPIAYLPYGDFRLGNATLAMQTTAGAGALIIGVLLITLGLTMWFQPIVRVFAGVASIILALVSIPVSNFGGLVIGFLFSLIGGAMSASWAPAPPVEETADAEHDGEPEGSDETETLVATGVPEQREGEQHMTATTIDAKGGRNSAG